MFLSSVKYVQNFHVIIAQFNNNINTQVGKYLQNSRQQLLTYVSALEDTASAGTLCSKELLHRIEKILVQNDPRAWLKQGWTRLSTQQKTIKSVEQVQEGMQVQAQLNDGSLDLDIRKVRRK